MRDGIGKRFQLGVDRGQLRRPSADAFFEFLLQLAEGMFRLLQIRHILGDQKKSEPVGAARVNQATGIDQDGPTSAVGQFYLDLDVFKTDFPRPQFIQSVFELRDFPLAAVQVVELSINHLASAQVGEGVERGIYRLHTKLIIQNDQRFTHGVEDGEGVCP